MTLKGLVLGILILFGFNTVLSVLILAFQPDAELGAFPLVVIGVLAFLAHKTSLWSNVTSRLRGPRRREARSAHALAHPAAEFVVEGTPFNTKRAKGILASYAQLLRMGTGRVSVRTLRNAMREAGVVRDVRAFWLHHENDFRDEVHDGILDWNNENCALFFGMMRGKHGLSQKIVIASVMYVAMELEYARFCMPLRHLRGSSQSNFIRELVLSDIYSGREMNQRHIFRLSRDLGIKGSRGALARRYGRTLQELQVNQFERNLHSQSRRSASVNEQIRTDFHLQEITKRISRSLDLDRCSYVIVGADHSRDSRLDIFYKKNCHYELSRAFDGHCCKCDQGMGQLEFDHFWCPKSEGGNFAMRSRAGGVYVNNCIPLCRSCNSSKGKRDFRTFFTDEQILRVVRKSEALNARINQLLADFDDPDFAARAF